MKLNLRIWFDVCGVRIVCFSVANDAASVRVFKNLFNFACNCLNLEKRKICWIFMTQFALKNFCSPRSGEIWFSVAQRGSIEWKGDRLILGLSILYCSNCCNGCCHCKGIRKFDFCEPQAVKRWCKNYYKPKSSIFQWWVHLSHFMKNEIFPREPLQHCVFSPSDATFVKYCNAERYKRRKLECVNLRISQITNEKSTLMNRQNSVRNPTPTKYFFVFACTILRLTLTSGQLR